MEEALIVVIVIVCVLAVAYFYLRRQHETMVNAVPVPDLPVVSIKRFILNNFFVFL